MKYGTAISFRQALQQHLKTRAKGDEAKLSRDRKRIAFDRLLARLDAAAPGRWLLKGGFALDLRLAERSRATKDVDIEWHAAKEDLLDALLDAAEWDASDFFRFEVERSATPENQLGGAHRFRVTAFLAGRFFEAFALDVGFRTEPPADTDVLATPGLLAFADIEPVGVPAMPLALQLAEKLHAYTRNYEGGRSNTRVKDLVDIALIAHLAELDAAQVRARIAATFGDRATHAPPFALPAPPVEWRAPFRDLAIAVGLSPSLEEGHAAAAALVDPLLDGRVTTGTWAPASRHWR